MRSKNKKPQSKFIIEEMEPRVLFSGGIEALIATELEPTIATYIDIDNHTEQTASQTNTTASGEHQTTELAFVDTGVEDYQVLVDDLLNNADTSRVINVILLDSTQNGIEQISDALLDHDDLAAIHVISHGDDGNVQLGNTTLNSDTLAENSLEIALWSQAFAEDGDFLIYGCNVAETQNGQNFVALLSSLTGTDVSASDDVTGNTTLGGDWDLEIQVGEITAETIFSAALQQNWYGTLDITT